MSSDGGVFQVRTGCEDRLIGGVDTLVALMPQEFYVVVDGHRTLAAIQFARWLRTLSEQQATGLGETLHHAEYVITNDPATVEERGTIHDCDQCRVGVSAAVRRLIERPQDDLLVGTLYWAGGR